MASNLPGGFAPASQALPSPAPSSALSTSTVTPFLPRQRSHPLKPGSSKETSVIEYVDAHILAVNRRHAKKFSSAFAGDIEAEEKDRGYEDFKEVVKDIEAIADVLWVSGTRKIWILLLPAPSSTYGLRAVKYCAGDLTQKTYADALGWDSDITASLQTPYLISLAVLVNSYLPDFHFRPRSTFRLLKKLDTMFASLLQGEDADTGEALAGFENRRDQVSMTEKVRIRNIVETARLMVVEAQDNDDGDATGEEEDDEDGEMVGDDYGMDEVVNAPGRWEMESARVYEKTIQLLGDELGKQGN